MLNTRAFRHVHITAGPWRSMFVAYKWLVMPISPSYLVSNNAHTNSSHRHSSTNWVTLFAHFQVPLLQHDIAMWLKRGTTTVIVSWSYKAKMKRHYFLTDLLVCPSAWMLHSATCYLCKSAEFLHQCHMLIPILIAYRYYSL